MHLVLEEHDRCFHIAIHPEIVSAAHGHETVVVAVQIDDVLSTFNSSRIAGHGDDVLEYNIVGQQVEIVLAIGKTLEPFSDEVEEGSIGSEIGTFVNVLCHRSEERRIGKECRSRW